MLKSRKLTTLLFIFYLLALSGIVLFKTKMSFAFLHMIFNFTGTDINRSVNLLPFGGMLVLNGSPDYHEIVLNTLVFIPFGIFLGMLRKKTSLVHLIVPVFLTSLFFEVTQYVFVLGASDITDIMANTLGGVIGIGIYFVFHKICSERAYQVLNTIALVFTIGFVLLLSMVRPL